MPVFTHIPPLAPRSVRESEATCCAGFSQQVILEDGSAGKPIASAQWHATAGDDGVVQLVDLLVHPDHRRAGFGGMVLREVLSQVGAYHQLRNCRFRRIWASVEQKSQVAARAFLTQHGFHHVATIDKLHRGQDAMIYVKAYD